LEFSFDAYTATTKASVRVAVGDLNGSGIDDIITTTNQGDGHLRVFNGLTGAELTTGPWASEVAVFNKTATGAFVAAGDLTGNNYDDIVVGSALGGGTVKVYDGKTGALVETFQPFGANFKGGVRVAVGDITGSGIGDIVVGEGYGGSQVKVYSGVTQTVLKNFAAAPAGYVDGVSVAVGDLSGTGKDDLIIGRNYGAPSSVEVYSGTAVTGTGKPMEIGTPIIPFAKNYGYGVRVGTVEIDGIVDIIVAAGGLQGSTVKIYDGSDPSTLITEFNAFPDYPISSLWVAGSSPIPYIESTGKS
jgi:hypothetical protein